jgi:hypothetical protein
LIFSDHNKYENTRITALQKYVIINWFINIPNELKIALLSQYSNESNKIDFSKVIIPNNIYIINWIYQCPLFFNFIGEYSILSDLARTRKDLMHEIEKHQHHEILVNIINDFIKINDKKPSKYISSTIKNIQQYSAYTDEQYLKDSTKK